MAPVHRRVVLNEFRIITEAELGSFPLSDQELIRIAEWGGLEGNPVFLGSGTMGSAYQFGDRVLKITRDTDEAIAAANLIGYDHPNVYNVRGVARRFAPGATVGHMPHFPYIIVYDMVGSADIGTDMNLPNKEQQSVIMSIHASSSEIWFEWNSDLFEAIDKFVKWTRYNEVEISSTTIPKYASYEDKLDKLLHLAGLSKNEKEVLKASWAITIGLYAGKYDIDSSEAIIGNIERNRVKFKAVDDVAKGLTFLKQRGIIFDDLKTTNVMNVRGDMVIIDVGKSVVRSRKEIGTL